MKYKTVLSIAGSDPSGGAGIQADLKTITALGAYGMTVITALTAQNTNGVEDVLGIPSHFVGKQLETILADIIPDSIKIGMLHDSAIIMIICNILKDYPRIPIILDPVMVATSGDILLEQKAIDSIQEKLFPLSTLITPNRHELQILTQRKINNSEDLIESSEDLSRRWNIPVLAKGGDLAFTNEALDYLAYPDSREGRIYQYPKVVTQNTHGTGCTLSSAIATNMAKDLGLEESIAIAKSYIQNALQSGKEFTIGHGRGPVNHLWSIEGVLR
ncbi:bifunctional hydroxymethylpyrimidine kinase/phosphomethylpyrimidine kinase [Spirochaeta cellobiosiphila]|uniref:bifunctional hydroxymethylpyrimidine kinase/phosphomethylpyrimidine kinase n=1 Tax=Spirochaeta cellobiosiphila TaxID=504483 RepID=UPI00041ABE7F|nr:bifunctional hydroxymethylpyrimidine kinase/phosphomethylpyrimidine kinase [Spirochaeta cellobiosiphila]